MGVCVTPILHTDFYPKLLEKLFDLYFQGSLLKFNQITYFLALQILKVPKVSSQAFNIVFLSFYLVLLNTNKK